MFGSFSHFSLAYALFVTAFVHAVLLLTEHLLPYLHGTCLY